MTYTEADARRDGHGDSSADFVAWKADVEKRFLDTIGLDVDSILGDWMSADMFVGGMDEIEAHDALVEQAKEEWGEDVMNL